MKNKETYKAIPNTDEKYFISVTGKVKNLKGEILLWDTFTGYAQVTVGGKCQYVHRLVYLTFIGDIPINREIDHLDGNRLNNNLSNLDCVSHRVNIIRGKLRSKKSGLPTGISMTSSGKYQVLIYLQKKLQYFGSYSELKEAVKQYNKIMKGIK